MLYMMIGEMAENVSDKRAAARPAHLARLEALKADGRLILAGPIPNIDAADPGPAGFFGSLIVAEFPSLADAEGWFAADPYTVNGIYAKRVVRPYVRVLP